MTVYVGRRPLVIHSLIGAARELKCTPVRVLQLLKQGQLVGHRLGKDWLVLGPDLEEYKKRQRARLRKRYGHLLEN
jgi:hypothetical protein